MLRKQQSTSNICVVRLDNSQRDYSIIQLSSQRINRRRWGRARPNSTKTMRFFQCNVHVNMQRAIIRRQAGGFRGQQASCFVTVCEPDGRRRAGIPISFYGRAYIRLSFPPSLLARSERGCECEIGSMNKIPDSAFRICLCINCDTNRYRNWNNHLRLNYDFFFIFLRIRVRVAQCHLS